MTIIILILVGFISFILQATLVQAMAINGVSFNLLIITVVAFSFLRGQKTGMLLGFFIGLLQDVFFGYVLGVYALFYMTLGYINGIFYNAYYKDSYVIPIVAISLSDLLLNLLVFIVLFLFRGRIQLGTYMGRIILPELTYTAFVSVIFYRIFLRLNTFLIERNPNKGDFPS